MYIECDCGAATKCPQGRIASETRCRIWKDDPKEAGEEGKPARVSNRASTAIGREWQSWFERIYAEFANGSHQGR